MKLNFKKAQQEDFDTIMNHFMNAAQAMKNKNIDHWRHWLDIDVSRRNQVEMAINKGEFFLVFNDEYNVGMFKIMDSDPEYWGEKTDNARYIHALVVNPNFKGQNLGERILAQIESDLKEKLVEIMRLDCNAANKWLCEYYENQGFRKVGVKEMPWSTNNLYEKPLCI